MQIQQLINQQLVFYILIKKIEICQQLIQQPNDYPTLYIISKLKKQTNNFKMNADKIKKWLFLQDNNPNTQKYLTEMHFQRLKWMRYCCIILIICFVLFYMEYILEEKKYISIYFIVSITSLFGLLGIHFFTKLKQHYSYFLSACRLTISLTFLLVGKEEIQEICSSIQYFNILVNIYLALALQAPNFIIDSTSILVQIGVLTFSFGISFFSILSLILSYILIFIYKYNSTKQLVENYEKYQNQNYWSAFVLNKYPISFFVTKYQNQLQSFVLKNYNKEAQIKYNYLSNEQNFLKFLQSIKVNLTMSQFSIADEFKLSGKDTDFLTFLKQKQKSNSLLNQQKQNQKVYSQVASVNKDDLDKHKHQKLAVKKLISTNTLSFNKSNTQSQLKKAYLETASKTINENTLSDILIAQRLWQDIEAEHVIIRVFEGENMDEFMFSIEEYPVQNQSYQGVKKLNKKLTKVAISGLNSFNQKFNIFQNSLKYLKELAKEIDQSIQGRIRNTHIVDTLKFQINGMLQEAVILKNRIFCIENYMNIFVKKNQVKLKSDQINLDQMLSLLNNFFPQVDIKRNYLDKIIQNDQEKIMYILISYISNAATCAKVMPIKMEVSSVSNDPNINLVKMPIERITNENIQDNNSSNQYNSGIAGGGVIITLNNNQHHATEDDKPSPQQLDNLSHIQKANNNNNNNLQINQNKTFLSTANPQSQLNQNLPAASPTQIQSQYPSTNFLLTGNNNLNLHYNTGSQAANNSREGINLYNNQYNQQQQNPSNQFIQVRQNSFANDSNSYLDGIIFKISFYHEKGEGLMDHFNCSEDKDSSKVEQKILQKFVKAVGPQQNIICKSQMQIKSSEEEDADDVDDALNIHDFEQFAFYQNHFKQFYQSKQNQFKKISSKTSFSNNRPYQKSNYFNHQNEEDEENNISNNQTQDQYTLSTFELIVFRNSEISNNTFFKTRNSIASVKTHFQLNRINTDDMITRIKASSSNFQIANLNNPKMNINNISNTYHYQADGNQNLKNTSNQLPTFNFQKNLIIGNTEAIQNIIRQIPDQEEMSEGIQDISDELKHGEQHSVPPSIFQRTLQFQTDHIHDNQSHIQSFEAIPTQINKENKHEQLKQDSQQNILNCDMIELMIKNKENNEIINSNQISSFSSPLKTKSFQNIITISQSVKN
ncbi:transmembrane protein, putative (macronuclear) [Tetrahymena thermophila SB210]|uniref:Transmembrane protein, putative n=1 Tax=Tetrahymena thermophila (strain SB210) TaxID=312017 RepID=I7LXJ5_TETTS|nr:transmembrane protein, putative [Tetrahymena thermophila SB210]EAS04763.2 transmembrane protein, putative [Tetrahymena thermophila SB210]|eukprot:XP_001025008.2 transmembrane protein, putative [Tetrahymena thermophila SB210]